jgi:diaminohydroxyphosphoribosylaminopyrimidine deaminase/5-amino-6-(5-phosphoribosylamino)uracil reductase
MRFSERDEHFMRRALALARRGLGKTSPNPCVGAMVVLAGKIVGEGWHRKAGGPHAEVSAFRAAGGRAKGATLYVTMEPCCTWGKTPPCTDAIIAAGVKRVVVAALDLNPRHHGHGLTVLRRAGIRVEAGLLAKESAEMNEVFNKWITTGLPHVTAKAAMSLDGKIATRTGDSKWITGATARREAHRLRAGVDAVIVGANTVLRDNPRLTLRHGVRGRQPLRVVMDGRGRCPLTARVFSDRLRERTIVVTDRRSPSRWRRRLAQRGITVLMTKPRDLRGALRLLGRLNVTSVLIEGGGELLGAAFNARVVDRVALFYAPIVIGGATKVRGAQKLREVLWRRLADGTLQCEGRVAGRR